MTTEWLNDESNIVNSSHNLYFVNSTCIYKYIAHLNLDRHTYLDKIVVVKIGFKCGIERILAENRVGILLATKYSAWLPTSSVRVHPGSGLFCTMSWTKHERSHVKSRVSTDTRASRRKIILYIKNMGKDM